MGNLFRSKLFRAEKYLLLVCFSLMLINLTTIVFKGLQVSWMGYLAGFSVASSLIAIGLFYRFSGRSMGISLGLIGTGIYIWFSIMMSLYNYLLLPLNRSIIDPTLVQIDAWLGFYWPDLMIWASENPIPSTILKYTYLSTALQIIILIMWHGLNARAEALYSLLMVMTVSVIIAICFWGLFPSLGTAAYFDLPADVWNKVRPVVDYKYGQDLNALVATGPEVLIPNEVRGLIAFPSYHAVLAFVAIWSSRNIKFLFPIFLVLNIMMMPATLIHGGHHLVDLPAGLLTFILALFATKIIMRAPKTSDESRLYAAATMPG